VAESSRETTSKIPEVVRSLTGRDAGIALGCSKITPACLPAVARLFVLAEAVILHATRQARPTSMTCQSGYTIS
jgi:hypothetical protein